MKYALIGSGRLAKHLKFYFDQLHIPVRTWSRSSTMPLDEVILDCDVILLAITDSALNAFINEHLSPDKVIVHFAGGRTIAGAHSFHPLMTFSPRLYEPDFYKQIPFVVDEGFDVAKFFPFLKNPIYKIPPEKRALYHALCHMSANFPALIWVHCLAEFEQDLRLPAEIMAPLIQQVLNNTMLDREKALAGPIARRDLSTIEKHKEALASHSSLAKIYNHFTDWALSLPPMEAHL